MRVETWGGLRCRILGGNDARGGGDGPAVVLMHGFGAPGDDLVPLAAEIAAPSGTRFVFPEAPLLLPYELGGGVGRAWWMIDVMALQLALLSGNARDLTRDVPAGLAEANASIRALLTELEGALGVERERLVLGGFSQGAMLALDVALRSEEPLAGLVLMSGTYLAEPEWTPLMPRRAGLAVLESHGRDDPLLAFFLADKLRRALAAAGLDVTFVPFDGGHGIAPSVLEALGHFLHERKAGLSRDPRT